MAVFDGKNLSGVTGPLSFREYKKSQVVQTNPGKGRVKQALTTKKSAATFAVSGNLARSVNKKFSPILNKFQDGAMYNRLNAKLAMIYDSARNRETGKLEFNQDSFEILQGLQFNIESEAVATFRVLPKWSYADNVLKISLRSFKVPEQLKFPVDVFYCKLTFYTLLYDLLNQQTVKVPEEHSITITKMDQTVEPQEFIFDVPNGTLAITGMFLEFYNESRGFRTLFINKHFFPASICATVLVPGTFNDSRNRLFEKMPQPLKLKKQRKFALDPPLIQ
jgi:hypothetical protein